MKPNNIKDNLFKLVSSVPEVELNVSRIAVPIASVSDLASLSEDIPNTAYTGKRKMARPEHYVTNKPCAQMSPSCKGNNRDRLLLEVIRLLSYHSFPRYRFHDLRDVQVLWVWFLPLILFSL